MKAGTWFIARGANQERHSKKTEPKTERSKLYRDVEGEKFALDSVHKYPISRLKPVILAKSKTEKNIGAQKNWPTISSRNGSDRTLT
jgi:hypothetical protein